MKDLALMFICFAFGAAAVLMALCIVLVFPMLRILFAPQSLQKKYSVSWALVTGGTVGVGLEICKRLAKEGTL